MSTITFTCPHCSHSVQLPVDTLGKQGNCPGCKTMVQIVATPQHPQQQQPQQQTILGGSSYQLQEAAVERMEPSPDNADDLLEYYTARAENHELYETKVDHSNRTIPHYSGLFLMLLGVGLCALSTFYLISEMSSPIGLSSEEVSQFTGPDVHIPREDPYISATFTEATLIWIGLAGWISLFIAHRFCLDKSRVGNFTTNLLLALLAMPLFGFLFTSGYLGPLTCPISALLALVAFWAAGGQRFN